MNDEYQINEWEDMASLINMASPDLREITFHSDGRVIIKTGGRSKIPKKLYSVKPKDGLTNADLVKLAIHKMMNELYPQEPLEDLSLPKII